MADNYIRIGVRLSDFTKKPASDEQFSDGEIIINVREGVPSLGILSRKTPKHRQQIIVSARMTDRAGRALGAFLMAPPKPPKRRRPAKLYLLPGKKK